MVMGCITLCIVVGFLLVCRISFGQSQNTILNVITMSTSVLSALTTAFDVQTTSLANTSSFTNTTILATIESVSPTLSSQSPTFSFTSTIILSTTKSISPTPTSQSPTSSSTSTTILAAIESVSPTPSSQSPTFSFTSTIILSTTKSVSPTNTSQSPTSNFTSTIILSTTKSVSPTPTSQSPTTGQGKKVWWVGALWRHVKSLNPLYGVVIMACILGLFVILLFAFCCLCCRYRSLKRRTHFPKNAHIGGDTHDWIHANDELLMWEKNLRAGEVTTHSKSTSNRPPPYSGKPSTGV